MRPTRSIPSILESTSRGRFLGGVSAGSLLLAGCSSGGKTDTDGHADEPEGASGELLTDGGIDVDETDDTGPRRMEALDRGVVAVPAEDGILVRWRLLGTEPRDAAFDVYRDGERVTDEPVTESTNYRDPDGEPGDAYAVERVDGGGQRSDPVEAWDREYRRIPLERPDPVEAAAPDDDSLVAYHANDASVGDLTGDGSLDVVLKWSPENAKDNAHEGYTNQTILDAYELDGTHLWRIELGRNVRAGAHYTQFLVYDFDGDGRAELAVRTADGTVDGEGAVIGDPDADYRNETGRIIEGPEYFTVFDGETGAALTTIDYEPARGDIADWGDDYGNRGDRFLAGVAYLDGERPSIVNARGYYEKTMLAAYDFRDGELTQRWVFDSTEGNEAYEGQGNHQLSVADVDGDGRDEIVYGACVVDHDGTGLYSTGWLHGDALHCGDFLPEREGLEVYQVHEPEDAPHGASMREAGTGELIWGEYTGTDTGRGMVADIDPEHDGAEAWAPAGVGLHTADGERIGETPASYNSAVWWTGDLRRELLDHDWEGDGVGIPTIERWDPDAGELERLETFEGTRSNNWTKGNPCLSGDLLGDWREEVLLREPDSEALRLYATPHETGHRIPTLLHDPQYRLALAWQNVAYNQPPHPSFFLGVGMDDPPTADLELVSTDD
nr:rhamnogalacturonan lyase [Halosimplex salinum]